MTHDETRDELARMDGAYFSMDREMGPIGWCDKNGTLIGDHPHAPTLDGANAAVPEGYEWERDHCVRDGKWCFLWWAHNDTTHDVIGPVPDTGDPVHDLYALALACRRAMEERK